MVSINKSFFYGIGVASITWLMSLCFYFQLIKHDNLNTVFPTNNLESHNSSHLLKDGKFINEIPTLE